MPKASMPSIGSPPVLIRMRSIWSWAPRTLQSAASRYRFDELYHTLKSSQLIAPRRQRQRVIATGVRERTDVNAVHCHVLAAEVTSTGVITNNSWPNYGPASRIEEVHLSSTILDALVNYDFTLGRIKHLVGLNERNLPNPEW